ncbi:hypothetical protein LB569_04770 [Mesorhizobium sp. BH1-1-4]|nr:hypothetical protein [Mesorhizobium sp. BH1-1-4]
MIQPRPEERSGCEARPLVLQRGKQDDRLRLKACPALIIGRFKVGSARPIVDQGFEAPQAAQLRNCIAVLEENRDKSCKFSQHTHGVANGQGIEVARFN